MPCDLHLTGVAGLRVLRGGTSVRMRVEDVDAECAEHEASGFDYLVQAQPGRQGQLAVGGLAPIAHLSETGFLGGEGEGVFQVGQFGGAELAWAIHEHDGPLTEQVLAPVNVLDDPVDGAVAVFAALGLPNVDLGPLVRGVTQHHVDAGLAHVLVGAEVADLPGWHNVEPVGHVR